MLLLLKKIWDSLNRLSPFMSGKLDQIKTQLDRIEALLSGPVPDETEASPELEAVATRATAVAQASQALAEKLRLLSQGDSTP